ncbi:MAG: type III-A CRISPR-associated protein Csm2 [Deltaproteobacteria bacterium]|nr:type III-A CRISPR-associated protein Csm2 [Deltaproteobacteria bacterium]
METPKLWKDKEKGQLDPVLFSQVADQWASKIDKDGRDDRGYEKRNASSQLRRFFDEVVRLNSLAQQSDSAWDTVFPQVHMLVAKAAYAQGRTLISDSFVKLLKDSIFQVETKSDLKVMVNFFESFMGFYKTYRKK